MNASELHDRIVDLFRVADAYFDWQSFGQEVDVNLDNGRVMIGRLFPNEILAERLCETAWQVVRGLSARGQKTRLLQRFIRSVECDDRHPAREVWEQLELDLEALMLRLRHPFALTAEAPVSKPATAVKRKRGRPRRCDPEQDRRIANSYRNGSTKDELAIEYGLTVEKVSLAIDRERKRRNK